MKHKTINLLKHWYFLAGVELKKINSCLRRLNISNSNRNHSNSNINNQSDANNSKSNQYEKALYVNFCFFQERNLDFHDSCLQKYTKMKRLPPEI